MGGFRKIERGGVIRNLATTGRNTRREWGDVRKTTNRLRLRLQLRSGREKVSGTRWNEVFVGGSGSWAKVASLEVWWSGGEVVSGGGVVVVRSASLTVGGRRGRTKS